MIKKNKTINTKIIIDFVLNEERRSSVFLIISAIAALIIANSSLANFYNNLFGTELTLAALNMDIKHWINEGLMALFFLVVGLEIKREFIDGELQTWRKASFPVIAAIGGMIVPALIFTSINPYLPQSSGWAIPMATDIAVAVGVIGLLGKRIPKNLRVFLLTLAIVDDIGSIVVINLFYNQPTNMFALVLSFFILISLLLIRRQKKWLIPFLVFSIALWYCLLLSGISATIAGVVIAFIMPLRKSVSNESKIQLSELIENKLIPFTSFFVVPLFVFANAGISFSELSLKESGSMSIFIGVLLGLAVGKPLGIFISSWLGDLTKISQKPTNISWVQIIGVGFLAGIGFTISLLITGLAYNDYTVFQNAATLGIFIATIISGLVGLSILAFSKNNTRKI